MNKKNKKKKERFVLCSSFPIYSIDECMFIFIDFAVHLPNLAAVVVLVVDSQKAERGERGNKKCGSKKDIVDPGLLLLHFRMKKKHFL